MNYYNGYQIPNSYTMQNTYAAQAPMQPQGNIVWVQGKTSAEVYPIAPGNKLMLMDSNEPVLYVKEADITGKLLPMKIFDLTERKEKIEPVESVKEEIDYEKIRDIIKEESVVDYDKIKDMITTEVCSQIDNLTVSSTKKGESK